MMVCPRCHTENREGRRFCGECGLSFASTCPSCGFLNEGGEKFCGGCGRSLAAGESIAPRPAPPTPEAERRQLTVMFCDLVGSTDLAARLDPEVLREVVRSYQEVCGDVIGRLHGHIAQYLGDGLLVYFGYPTAREDDPRRAVHAGLRIIDAIGTLNARLQGSRGITLAIRVGIHTGPVVVGEIGGAGRREHLALGETPNVAARLQAIAQADTVVISAATHRLLRDSFACTDLGVQAIKGLPAALRAYQVQDDGAAGNVPEASGAQTLTPLVGREQEVGLLLDRWDHVKDGRGQVVLLSGEPGIGKSRLVRVLNDHIATERHLRWECRCSPYHQDSALYPLIDLFERALEFGRHEAPGERFAKIEAALARRGLAQPEALAVWAAFLSAAVPDSHPPLSLTPQRQKQKTFEGIAALLVALAAEQPVLFIIEDLHWADPSTRELIDLVLGQVPAAAILLVMTSRPEFVPPWAGRSHLMHLTVNRVTRNQTELMVERVVGGKRLPAEVLQQIVAKTDGVPLFVEELTTMVLESGLLREDDDRYALTGTLPPLAIPSTLQDSLMARLDRLATVKEVAQVGAALGRTFHYALLRAVAGIDDETLQRALARLGESELLHQRGVPPDATYIFKHALIQETAYQSMLISRRQQLHKRIGDTLVERFSETAGSQPELVAHHYTEAGLPAEAVDYWAQAGQRAIERSANAEAISHLRKALDALKSRPNDPDRLHRELDLLTTLGPVLMASKGYGSLEVEGAYTRALELCRQMSDNLRLFAALRGLWECYELRGDFAKALGLAEELLSLAQSAQDSALLVVAHDVMGDTLLWLPEFRRAGEHFEKGIALYESAQHHASAQLHGAYDPGVLCRSFSAHVLWFLGYPDRAIKHSDEALALAARLSHPFSLATAIQLSAYLHHYRREVNSTEQQAEAGRALSAEQGFAFSLACVTILHGWARVQQGQREQGATEIRRGLDFYRTTGAVTERPLWLALLAEAHALVGEIDEGLTAVTQALAEAAQHGTRFYDAELLRLRGELLLKRPVPQIVDAEGSFREAMDTARRQEARSLELRVAISLARLLGAQGKRDDARRLLAEIHGWFTEGFDTADLREAKTLLDELSGG